MHIGFDAKRYFHNYSGLGNYSRDLVDTLIQQYPNNRYYLFDPNPSHLQLPANTIAAVPKGNSIAWRSYGIQKDIALHGIDIYHGLSNELPFGKWNSKTKKVITIHDVIFKVLPESYPFLDRLIYHRKTKHGCKVADSIIATSRATANDIVQYYKVREDKIKVVYQTCGQQHWLSYSDQRIREYVKQNKLPEKFIVYVSSFNMRKNHLQLLQALKQLGKKEIHLVLAGRKGETLSKCISFVGENNLGNQVTFINDIRDSDLPYLYRASCGFVYPSTIEGFGIPLIEAACAGLPMAVNDIPVFRELAAPGTHFFHSKNTPELAEALQTLWNSNRKDYSVYLQQFNSSHAAEKMYDIYKALCP